MIRGPMIKQILSEYLDTKMSRDALDPSFLKTAQSDNCQCPVHDLPLVVAKGYKVIPDRSLSQIPEAQNEEYPYAICWTRSLWAEKHGPIEPALIIYCPICDRAKREAEHERETKVKKDIFSDDPGLVYII